MMFFLHHAVSSWLVAPLLAAHLAFGLGAGWLYFRALRRATDLFANGGAVATALAMGAGRLCALGLVLLCAACEGALPLLSVAAGVLLARGAALRAPETAA